MPEPAFRVIVVGAGVAGLTASHCLEKAGIQHVVLERRSEIAPPEGASIAIYPHGARILHQIGCLVTVKKACVPCDRWWCRRPDGKTIMNNGFFGYIKEKELKVRVDIETEDVRSHGHDILLLERRQLLQILYDGLPDKTRIRTGCAVKEVKQFVSGVEVTMVDGTVEKGDIVLGCDGVNSLVRDIMWDSANKMTPGLITAKEKTSTRTEWKCLIGVAPSTGEMGQCDMTVVHDNRYSFLALSQPDKVFFFVFFRLDKPFTWPKRKRYSDEEAEELAASVASHPVSELMVFGELWKKRSRGALVPIEEGLLDHWHHGRLVLAGDSAHKVTPNIALGGNSGMESIAVLCNHLRQMMVNQSGAKPSLATLNNTFASYQLERHARMKHIMDYSRLITKVQAWDTPFHKFLANWVLPLQPDRAIADQLGEIIRGAPKLDYVSMEGFTSGSMQWKDEAYQVREKAKEKVFKDSSVRLMQMMSAGMVAMALLMFVYAAQYISPILSP